MRFGFFKSRGVYFFFRFGSFEDRFFDLLLDLVVLFEIKLVFVKFCSVLFFEKNIIFRNICKKRERDGKDMGYLMVCKLLVVNF